MLSKKSVKNQNEEGYRDGKSVQLRKQAFALYLCAAGNEPWYIYRWSDRERASCSRRERERARMCNNGRAAVESRERERECVTMDHCIIVEAAHITLLSSLVSPPHVCVGVPTVCVCVCARECVCFKIFPALQVVISHFPMNHTHTYSHTHVLPTNVHIYIFPCETYTIFVKGLA